MYFHLRSGGNNITIHLSLLLHFPLNVFQAFLQRSQSQGKGLTEELLTSFLWGEMTECVHLSLAWFYQEQKSCNYFSSDLREIKKVGCCNPPIVWWSGASLCSDRLILESTAHLMEANKINPVWKRYVGVGAMFNWLAACQSLRDSGI